jgi:predicted CoA-binding protein
VCYAGNLAGLGFIEEGMNLHFPEKYVAGSDAVAQILRGAKTIAVVGLSSKPMRASHGVAEYLKAAGYRIIPVNPNETQVLGEKAYARLEDVPEPVDIVDVFRQAEEVTAVAESAIRIGAKVLWMQLGIENAGAAEKAQAAGLVVVEDSCLMVEHKRRK